jgi:hypothetical protein
MASYSRKYKRPAETKRSTGQPIGTRDSRESPLAALVGRIVALRGPHQDRRADARLRLVVIESTEQRRGAERATDECRPRVTQFLREAQRQREVDETRLAREHVAGLCGVTCDHDRRAAVTSDRALCHRRYRGREDLRLDEERRTEQAVLARGRDERVLQLRRRRLTRCRHEHTGACVRRLQDGGAREARQAGHRQLDADPATRVCTGVEQRTHDALLRQLDRARTAQQLLRERACSTRRDDDERRAHRRAVGARQRREASMAADARDLAVIVHDGTMLQSTLEQHLLQATDRHECARRLRGELPQIRGLRRHARQCRNATADRATRREVRLAARRQERHDLRVADVDTEVIEVCQVTCARNQ